MGKTFFMRQFDFGENWREFSDHALTPDKIRQAAEDFASFMARGAVDVRGSSFLDIGFGQGLTLLGSAATGAKVVGCDINPKCAQVLQLNRKHFPGVDVREIPVLVGSILDPEIVESLRKEAPENGYDVVHSWGVLHHTGRMWQAIEIAASLVRPGGTLFLALYNRHWTSPAWAAIKRFYAWAPGWLQKSMVGVLYPVILAAKWVVTGTNPMVMDRGMNFYYNVVDWVGGYPYEYASRAEVTRYLEGRNFTLRVSTPAVVPTGCNEYVFIRNE